MRPGPLAAGIGYLVTPNLMSFVDGGYTRTHFTQSNELQTFNGAPITFAYPSYNVSGWFIGGGTEYQVPWAGFNGLFWRSEYRFATYSAVNLVEFSTLGLVSRLGTSSTRRPTCRRPRPALCGSSTGATDGELPSLCLDLHLHDDSSPGANPGLFSWWGAPRQSS